MSNDVAPVDESDLKLAYVRARLAEIERTRRVYLAAEGGMPEHDIARAVHLPQSAVHRLILRARGVGASQPVEEIVLERYAGTTSTEEMLQRLRELEVWVPRIVDPVDSVLPGSSEEVVSVLVEGGFLTEAEAALILAAHA